MNSLITDRAAIGCVLLEHFVNSSSGKWPSLEIITPQGALHLLAVQEVTLQQVVGGKLTFVALLVKPPMGRSVTVIWPPEGVESPALGITGLEVY
ncbi:MAG: hypothetical protein Q7R93_00910 [bacterium]|nr:hypothetical protein [bacterium]